MVIASIPADCIGTLVTEDGVVTRAAAQDVAQIIALEESLPPKP
jgi:hypothetical protein